MPTQTSRRDFLRGDLHGETVVRPPGARVQGFGRACTGCGDCAAACPEAIIRSDGHGAVLLDLSFGACTFCGDCARACRTGALSEARLGDWPWVVSVSAACLGLNRISCRSCEDACDARAIGFRLMAGGKSRPVVDQDCCTGCGACIPICPAAAMSLTKTKGAELEICQ